MTAKEADNLKYNDHIITFNGKYVQHGQFTKLTRDLKGMRWIDYSWINPSGEECYGCKRYMSVYLPEVKDAS